MLRLIASHVAHTFREKFACHMLPFNYDIVTPNGTNLIINTMQLQVEKYLSLPQSTDILPSQGLSSLTSPTRSAVSPVNCTSKSSQIPFPKSSPSSPSSTNKWGLSTTNGLMAHGTPSSWRRASDKAAHSHPFLPCLLSQTFSNHSTSNSNYVKEPPPAVITVTRGMMFSEALPIFLVTLTTSPHASPSRIYNSSVTDLPPLGLHWDASSTQ